MTGLIADRFAVSHDLRALDLATGLHVSLERSGSRLPTEVADAPAWHDGRALIDAGAIDASTTFLAWSAQAVTPALEGAGEALRERLAAAFEIIDTAGDSLGGCSLASTLPARLEQAWLLLARAARLRGIVPLTAAVVDTRPDLLPLLDGRLVAFLAPATRDGRAAGALVRALAGGDRHGRRVVLLFSFGGGAAGTPTLDLDARGGRMAFGSPLVAPGVDRVAEAAPALSLFGTQGVGLSGTAGPVPHSGLGRWLDPLATRWERRLARAVRAAGRGRRAACVRDLESLVRVTKGRDGAADLHTRAGLALAEAMLMAGRAGDAARAARQALAGGAQTVPALAARAACLLGHAWIEQQRFADAAGLLAAVVEGAKAFGGGGGPEARLALARCFFWEGRLDAAERQLEAATSDGSPLLRRSVLRMRARILLARDDVAGAGSIMASGVLRDGSGEPREAASAALLSACVQSAAGDMDAVRAHLNRALQACRRAALASRATAVHVAWVEAAARLGAADDVARGASVLARLRPKTGSALLRARVDRALAVARRRRGIAVGPWSGLRPARTGDVPAFACRDVRRPDATRGDSSAGAHEGPQREWAACARGERVVVDELLEVLTICHEADDEGPALERVCAALRTRLGASCVCVVGERPESRLALAGHHRAVSPEVAQRAIATGAVVPTALVRDGWEAAAPVRYGGTTIAALACRWTVDSTPDRARVEPVLATAAAACAPSVRAALDRAAARSVADTADLGLIGSSRAIDGVRAAIVRAAAVPFHVLIEGESGSGKELAAKAIHRVGPRRGRRFCAVNCAALPDDLLEAELFGHARGAFTGAVAERAGLFEDADGGTLFLDEVGELSPRAQAKLLRAIQESEVRRLGEALPRRVDVRILAASNRSLAAEADAGRFRVDLRYRLEVVRIVIPPLRDRREDVTLLAGRFWDEFARRAGTRALLDRAVLDALARYDWPGNVRELQNVVASLAVHAPRRGRVGLAQLPAALGAAARARGSTLDEARRAFEASYVRQALCRAGGRRSAAARELGLTRQGLSKLMARLGVGAPEPVTATGGTPPGHAPPADGSKHDARGVRAELA